MATAFQPLNVLTAVLVAGLPITLASLAPEPQRLRAFSILTASGSGLYLNNGFGPLEFPFAMVAGYCAYRGLQQQRQQPQPQSGKGNSGGDGAMFAGYRALGAAWVLHTVWDTAHHMSGFPMLSYLPTSAGECAITDLIVAAWLFAGGRSVFGR